MREELLRLSKIWIKLAIRKTEREKYVREVRIKKFQDDALSRNYDRNATKLILFIVDCIDDAGKEHISGGLLSINSIYEETAKLKDIHQSEVLLCTIYGGNLVFKFSSFETSNRVYRYEQLDKYFTKATEVMIHIPEYMVKHFVRLFSLGHLGFLFSRRSFHVNILNQNIRLMPPADLMHKLKELTANITVTTAHQKYCTSEYRAHFGVPIHKFSVWISPEQYHFNQYREKENLMVVSPDFHPLKEKILGMLKTVQGLNLRIIEGLTYTSYKELISQAKWSLTFGEGLDGYFIEPVFSGAISFAIYNNEFFTDDFESLETVYDSAESLASKMVSDIRRLDEPIRFQEYQQRQFELCAKYYSGEQYQNNIADFYNGEYSYA